MEQIGWNDWRVFYTRKGPTRYLSHLDINRAMQRALARSHLPVWYSQGFNPHIYITFALPTPLGYESECESVDFRLIEELPADEVLARLNACLPAGLRAIRAAAPVLTPEAIVSAEYEARVSAPALAADALLARLNAFFDRAEIPAEKKTKKGTRQLDLKPLTRVLERGLEPDGSVRVLLRLSAGPALNVNPSLLFDTFSALEGLELDCIRVRKLQVFAQNDGKETLFQ